MITMDRLRNFGFLIKEVSRRYVQRFERRASALSLTLAPCRVLGHLERNEGVCQSRLAELTCIEPMAMVRILDRMETDGLIERRPDPADRRARSLYLTPWSRPALEQIWQLAELTRSEAFAGVSESERLLFVDILERVNRNLIGLEAQALDAAADPVPLPTARAAGAKSRSRKAPNK